MRKQEKHHTSICQGTKGPILTGYTPSDTTLSPIIPVNIQGVTLWAYLDTGSGRNFISQDAIAKLKLPPVYHVTRHIVTVSGSKRQSIGTGSHRNKNAELYYHQVT